MSKDPTIEQFKQEVKTSPNKSVIKKEDLLSTGSTQVNLDLTGTVNGGIAKGHYVLLVGKSGSGKTWLSLSLMAEACINPQFDNHLLIYDPIEDGAVMDLAHYFGPLATRIQPPKGTIEEPEPSKNVEELYANLDRLQSEGKPFIYIVDSMDGLSSLGEDAANDEKNQAISKGSKVKGTYAMSKQKENSARLRVVRNKLKETGSILVIICQTRDNIGFGSQFNPDTHGGGNALTFYAHIVLWTKVSEQMKVRVAGKDRQNGTKTKIRISKNRLNGKLRTSEIVILHGLGIDDVGSCIDYLIDEPSTSKWKETGGKISAPDFEFSGKREELIKYIEDNGKERILRRIVSRVWHEIEEATTSKRKRRY